MNRLDALNLRPLSWGIGLTLFWLMAAHAIAQEAAILTAPATTTALPATSATEARPLWGELSLAQQQFLSPLEGSWSGLLEVQKSKWLALAKNQNTLSPADVEKLQARMTAWAALSPKERDRARLSFAEVKKINPEDKAATWEAYQALSEEEKGQLAAKAPVKPKGAAAVIKPVSPKKLAIVPSRPALENRPKKVFASINSINPHTLLPKTPPKDSLLAPSSPR